jgi:hypothetical protein
MGVRARAGSWLPPRRDRIPDGETAATPVAAGVTGPGSGGSARAPVGAGAAMGSTPGRP